MEQQALQRGSLAVAILSQIPEHRAGIDGIAAKAISFLDMVMDRGIAAFTEPDEEDDEEDEDEDDPLAEAVA